MDQDLKNLFDQAAQARESDPEVSDVFDKARVTELDDETKNVFDRAARHPDAADIFAAPSKKSVSARDIFSGPESLFDVIEELHPSPRTKVKQAALTTGEKLRRFFSPANIVIMINIVAFGGIFTWIVYKHKTTPRPSTAAEALTLIHAFSQEHPIEAKDLGLSDTEAGALEEAKSWQLGRKLYETRKYSQAYYIFNELREEFNTGLAGDEYMRDFLTLNMALALEKTTDLENLSKLFKVGLESRSPVVRALSNYHLMFLHMQNHQYLNARARAYRTLALMESLRDNINPNIEADCYFIICESLTRYVINLFNDEDELPGTLWTNTLKPESLPDMDQDELTAFLQTGVFDINQGAITPIVRQNTHLDIGSKWCVISFDIPFEEVLTRFASEIKINITWPENQEGIKQRPTTVFLPAAAEQRIPEIAAGSSYLIARYDNDAIDIYNPENFPDLNRHKAVIAAEAVSAWRKFLIRCRGDHRTPNAHYALGRLMEYSKHYSSALGEYRLLINQYPTNPLAPYALLNSSLIKTNSLDYIGAGRDLQELLIQYPDSRLVDQASLYLADATMSSGRYDQAIQMYHKVYNIDLNPEPQRQSCYGLGLCYYESKDWSNAREWLIKAIRLINNPADHRLKPAFYMLGKANIELGNYEEASLALKNSIDTSAPRADYIETILVLAEAERRQEHYVTAMNILQSIPAINLSQDYAAAVLIKKAQILQEMDLVDSAITLLRRKIEFIAESSIRAELSCELAICHARKENYHAAYNELLENIQYLKPGLYAQKMRLLFARCCLELDRFTDAIEVAKMLENDSQPDIRREAAQIRGFAWEALGEHEKAALAFAGLPDTPASAKKEGPK